MFATVLQCNLETCMKIMSLPAAGCSCPLVGNSQEYLLDGLRRPALLHDLWRVGQ